MGMLFINTQDNFSVLFDTGLWMIDEGLLFPLKTSDILNGGIGIRSGA
jgi:hypothetical protein